MAIISLISGEKKSSVVQMRKIFGIPKSHGSSEAHEQLPSGQNLMMFAHESPKSSDFMVCFFSVFPYLFSKSWDLSHLKSDDFDGAVEQIRGRPEQTRGMTSDRCQKKWQFICSDKL